MPTEASRRQALAEVIGRDGVQLLEWQQQPETPPGLAELERVQVLRERWAPFYDLSGGQVRC